MRYDPVIVAPMREELTSIGATELLTPEDVDGFMADKAGTTLLVVNSVCGCAAGMARPGLRAALEGGSKPGRIGTVFAGMEIDATNTARGYAPQVPPSSPSMFLFKDGELVFALPRHAIEGQTAEAVAAELRSQFDKFCG
jgi:putative YphP/YqiW family bacilliredoxin